MNRFVGTFMNDPKRGLYWSVLIALALVALTMALWPRAEAANLRNPYRRLHVDVKRALSGNKIRLKSHDGEENEDVIYAGIRAPHRHEPLFEAARQRNAELVNTKEARLRFGEQKHDKRGRLLAYVFVDDEFVNEALVRDGLAYVRLTTGTRRFADRLLTAQTEARKNRLGLWKDRGRAPEERYPADPKYGNFHRPDCVECPKINSSRLTTFESAAGAINKGFAPCPKCKP